MKVPLFSIPDTPITARGQDHLPIADIVDDLVVFKDGGASLVMEATSLNFGLLSEREQEAVIAAYAALLNSLTYPIQIVIRTQRKDISEYLRTLAFATQKITNSKLFYLAQSYKEFIFSSIKKKNVLGKKFYIVIPFSPLEMGIAKSFFAAAPGAKTLPFPKSSLVKKAKLILHPKRDHLIRQAQRLGIRLRQLRGDALCELFYNVYNQEPPISEKHKEEVSN